MDYGVCGPDITPLPETADYDATEISAYITTVLQQLKQEGAYGIFVGLRDNTGGVVPTFIIGVPQVNAPEVALPPPPQDLPIWVKEDSFISMPGIGEKWALNPVFNPGRIALEGVSVGIETGSLRGAGSFCGFLKKGSSPGKIFGITAAHCMPGARTGMAVCSPSTIEVTSRFNRLLRYTTICPPPDRLHITQPKQTEVQSILQQFRFHEHPAGTTFLGSADSDQWKTGVLSGQHLGEIVSYNFGSYASLLHRYDQKLQRLGLRHFFAGRFWETRMDWCIFSCNMDRWLIPLKLQRYGGNIYEGETVREIGYLYPRAEVEKMGRSTGLQCGKVNPIVLQRWESGQITCEIAIIGKDEGFAGTGDSGGCVLVNENGTYKAAGILIGKTKYTSIAVATPLAMILDSAADYWWA
ncbi:hypothetical protein C7212DRAFT_361236 [Tuber magnatum]|uniref:Peptidase S1 domain-containing protein n=1 Tax=Tuber magnatum TaxID=42249 RepID=A0A317T5J4_9PEZI|nr:hypothetical protein C7212DRAFT_361236 [Tuber magnatum]